MAEGLPLEVKLPLLFARASTFSFGAMFEAILIGIAFGTVIDANLNPEFLWPPDSILVTDALLPVFGASLFMLALAAADGIITVWLRENVAHILRFEVRRYVRPLLLHLLKLGHFVFLALACASVALWTHVYLWHGHIWPWLFALVAAFVANGASVAAKTIFLLDGLKSRSGEKTKSTMIDKLLMSAGLALVVVAIAQHFIRR